MLFQVSINSLAKVMRFLEFLSITCNFLNLLFFVTIFAKTRNWRFCAAVFRVRSSANQFVE